MNWAIQLLGSFYRSQLGSGWAWRCLPRAALTRSTENWIRLAQGRSFFSRWSKLLSTAQLSELAEKSSYFTVSFTLPETVSPTTLLSVSASGCRKKLRFRELVWELAIARLLQLLLILGQLCLCFVIKRLFVQVDQWFRSFRLHQFSYPSNYLFSLRQLEANWKRLELVWQKKVDKFKLAELGDGFWLASLLMVEQLVSGEHSSFCAKGFLSSLAVVSEQAPFRGISNSVEQSFFHQSLSWGRREQLTSWYIYIHYACRSEISRFRSS